MIENILPFVLNTERLLTDADILAEYFLVYFARIENLQFAKIILLISQQPFIHQRPFCIKNEWEPRYNSNKNAIFWKIGKTPNFGYLERTHGKGFWT